MTENIAALTGDLTEGLKKNQMAEGEITRISIGEAKDFMTPEQCEARKVSPVKAFVEMEIVEKESGTIFTKTFPLYVGNVPENSIMGGLIATYGAELKEMGTVNLMTKAIKGKNDDREFVVWEIIVG